MSDAQYPPKPEHLGHIKDGPYREFLDLIKEQKDIADAKVSSIAHWAEQYIEEEGDE